MFELGRRVDLTGKVRFLIIEPKWSGEVNVMVRENPSIIGYEDCKFKAPGRMFFESLSLIYNTDSLHDLAIKMTKTKTFLMITKFSPRRRPAWHYEEVEIPTIDKDTVLGFIGLAQHKTIIPIIRLFTMITIEPAIKKRTTWLVTLVSVLHTSQSCQLLDDIVDSE